MAQGLGLDVSSVRKTSFSCQGSIIDFAEFQLPISDLKGRVQSQGGARRQTGRIL